MTKRTSSSPRPWYWSWYPVSDPSTLASHDEKSALSMMWACMGAGSVITFQWYLWGYSLAFSPTGQNGFIGDLKRFGLLNTLANPSSGSPLIPNLLYAFYQVSVSTVGANCQSADSPRCNSAWSPPPSPWEPWRSEAGSCPPWSGRSCGPRSPTAPSPAEPGTRRAGATYTA